MIFFAILPIILTICSAETYKKTILLRRAKRLSIPIPPGPPAAAKLKFLLSVTLLRPLHMLVTEPIVAFMSLYTAFNFSVLFAFFAAFPYVFRSVYGFNTEQVGLVFLAIGAGCILALVTVVLCDRFFYQPQVRASLAEGKGAVVLPEYRLYPALMGGLGMPISLFWFGWSARSDVHWASPVIAAIPFGWANLTIFIGKLISLPTFSTQHSLYVPVYSNDILTNIFSLSQRQQPTWLTLTKHSTALAPWLPTAFYATPLEQYFHCLYCRCTVH